MDSGDEHWVPSILRTSAPNYPSLDSPAPRVPAMVARNARWFTHSSSTQAEPGLSTCPPAHHCDHLVCPGGGSTNPPFLKMSSFGEH